MKKKDCVLWIVCFLVCIFAPIVHIELKQTNLPRLSKSVSSAVVWIGAEYSADEYNHYPTAWGKKPGGEWEEVERNKIKWQGTGFIVSSDGLIATAGHIVEDTETFQLVFSDGRRGRARFVYMEDSENADVGFIQVTWIQHKGFHILDVLSYIVFDKILLSDPVKNLPYFKFDTKVKLAEDLIIVGYPWGLQKGLTITQGIVSAVDRNIPFFGEKFMIHTDTASWPGNSGSPVIDMDGEVVGILVGGVYGADNFSLITPAKIAQLALNKHLANEAMREAR